MVATGELVALAVPAALAGAAAMGLANAAQAKAMREAPQAGGGAGLVLYVVRNRTWLAGGAATAAGLVLQLVALGFGPLSLVQPLLVTSLLFTTVFVAWLRHGRVEGPILRAALLASAGLAAFLWFADPSAGAGTPTTGVPVLPVAALLLTVLVACFGLVNHAHPVVRVLALALATGLLYGVTATLMKLVAVQFRTGPLVPFGHWSVYAALLCGVTGFVLSQRAFAAASHAAPAVAVITTVDPLVAMGLGSLWFGEGITVTPGALLGELLAGGAIIGGIALLARHGERLAAGGRPESTSGDVTSPEYAVSSC